MKPRQPASGKVPNPAVEYRKMRMQAKLQRSACRGAFFHPPRALVLQGERKKGKNIMAKRLFTSESVTEGHPDKICDQISDAVLDAMLERDPMVTVACETTVTTGLVHVMGEITTNCYVDIPKIGSSSNQGHRL